MLHNINEAKKRNKAYRKNIQNLFKHQTATDSDDSETDSKDSDTDSQLNSSIDYRNKDFNLQIENLAANISEIDLEREIKDIIMPNETNYQQLRLFLDIIPNFNGDPCELNNFITACDETYINFQNEGDAIKKLIFRGIVGKLKGKALTIISSRLELDTWDKVKEVLKLSFCDQRSFTCLPHELHSLSPNPKENAYNFSVRC